MESAFNITLYLKTPSGFEIYGIFNLGNNRQKARDIFDQLKGSDSISEKSMLYMDFAETRDGVSLPVAILHCTIEDIAVNTRIITREVFKNLNLEAS